MNIFLFCLLIASVSAQLKSKAKKIYLGSAINSGHLDQDAEYKKVAAQNFNCLTAEYEMKMDPIEKNQGQFDFALADKIVEFGHQNGMKVRAHTLVWHNALPKWVETYRGNKTALEKVMTDYISKVVDHYKGKVYCWDVVNEVVGDDGKMRSSVWYDTFGTQFINMAFKLAHQHDPSAKLYINDYNTEGHNAKSNTLFDLVSKLKSEGVPINGVGFQSHFSSGNVPADLQSNMQRFADLGLDVAITELDIRVKTPATAAELEQQAKDYANVVAACESVSQCVGVTVWGFTDKYSWIPATFPGYGASNLFDNSYHPKPAVSAVEKVLH